MKRLVLLGCGLALSVAAGQARANGKYGMAGCGLGSLVIKKNDFMQVFAATLNGTGVQTFGITTGTSNCKEGHKTAEVIEQEHFVVANLTSLNKDMARGEGETLRAFAHTLGCPNEVYPTLAREAQDAYATIMAAPGAIAVLERAKAEFKTNPTLSAQCQHLI